MSCFSGQMHTDHLSKCRHFMHIISTLGKYQQNYDISPPHTVGGSLTLALVSWQQGRPCGLSQRLFLLLPKEHYLAPGGTGAGASKSGFLQKCGWIIIQIFVYQETHCLAFVFPSGNRWEHELTGKLLHPMSLSWLLTKVFKEFKKIHVCQKGILFYRAAQKRGILVRSPKIRVKRNWYPLVYIILCPLPQPLSSQFYSQFLLNQACLFGLHT